MAHDLARELQEGGDSWPQTWKPEPGERLVGRLVRTATRTTKYGPGTVAIVEDDDGLGWCVYLSTVLKAAFEEQWPQADDRLAIQYHGKHELKGYHLHTLICERGAPRPPRPARAAPAPRSADPASASQPVNRGPAEVDADDPFVD